MHVLYLVTVLAVAPVVTEPAAAPPTEPPAAVIPVVVTPQFTLAEPRRSSPLELDPLVQAVPFGGELNAFYRRYRADGRFRGGIGLSFSLLGERQSRWTLTIGPVQFRFGGPRPAPPSP